MSWNLVTERAKSMLMTNEDLVHPGHLTRGQLHHRTSELSSFRCFLIKQIPSCKALWSAATWIQFPI